LGEKAVEYWLKAPQQAISRGAMVEAVAQVRRGLDLLPSVPAGTGARRRSLIFRLYLGTRSMRQGDWARVSRERRLIVRVNSASGSRPRGASDDASLGR
jgi:hypothetical protein